MSHYANFTDREFANRPQSKYLKTYLGIAIGDKILATCPPHDDKEVVIVRNIRVEKGQHFFKVEEEDGGIPFWIKAEMVWRKV